MRLLHRLQRLAWPLLPTLVVIMFVTGCATPRLPPHGAQPSAHLPTTTPSALQQAIAPLAAAHAGQSGFQLLATGSDALAARLSAAQAAQHSLDLQYYSASEDVTGKLLLQALLNAAQRGVRVRLLVDDINRRHTDPTLAALSLQPNIEIRVFNPFGTRDTTLLQRTGNLIMRFDQLNRRMHNKALIADNQIAIVGGRNLGDEYFDANPAIHFRDFDLLCAGPITDLISQSFDRFWNSEQTYPFKQVSSAEVDSNTRKRTLQALSAHWDALQMTPVGYLTQQPPLATRIRRRQLSLLWANAELAVDSPAKLDAAPGDVKSPPAEALRQLTAHAQREILIMSAYFVPRDAGVAFLAEATRRGVHVRVLTNSLASTDVVPVHAGYARSRPQLLAAGIDLYEFMPIRPPSSQLGGLSGSSRASLHAKAYVIDRHTVVIGSFNLDPRSARLNTELTVIIHSPAFAQQMADIFERAVAPRSSFRVSLAPNQSAPTMPPLQWTGEQGGQLRTFDVEPMAGFWRNAVAGAFTLVPNDDLL